MRKTLIVASMLLAAWTANTAAAPPQALPGQPAVSASLQTTVAAEARPDDERAIRNAATAFAAAYRAKDAKAVSALFAPEGEIVDEQGNCAHGQEAIERVFAEIFQADSKSHIEIAIESIRFFGQTLAMEDGTSTVIDDFGQTLEHNRYTVVHMKRDGIWRMISARDLPNETRLANEELEPLAWLIGDWVDESPNAVIITSCRWAEHHDFILSDFTVQVGGQPAMTGSQRIGWDPQAKKLHSWVFDSEGGFAEGIWTRRGNQWLVKMTGVTRDGKAASSTNITTHLAKDRMTWQSRDRVVGDEVMPDTEEVPIVRQPPRPQTAAHAHHASAGESQ
jgi:uncharacterized protein (TIGR02246 family)